MIWNHPSSCAHPRDLLVFSEEPTLPTQIAAKCLCGEPLTEIEVCARRKGNEIVNKAHRRTCYYCGGDISYIKNHSHDIKTDFGNFVFGGHCICNHHARTILLRNQYQAERDIVRILELDLYPNGNNSIDGIIPLTTKSVAAPN